MATYLSFGEQALRYVDRPHEAIPAAPVGGSAAWRGEDLAQRDDWMMTLTRGQIAELDQLRDALRARGLTPATLRREDVALPALAPTIAAWRREQFAPGDVQLVSNHVILHARTAYEDAPDPARQRHLLRLWLSLDRADA